MPLKEPKQVIDYNHDKQKLLLRYLISSETAFVRCQNILDPLYWNDKLRPAARYLLKFANEYNKLPSSDLVKAETGIDVQPVEAAESFGDWFLDEIEEFCRHKAMEALIYDGPTLLENGEYAELERRSRDNMLISLQKDMGTDYFSDPLARLQKMKDRTGMTSTGWRDIDAKLYGGFNRGELSFFVGGPGCVTGDTFVRVIKLVEIDEEAYPYLMDRRDSNHAKLRFAYLQQYYTLEQIYKFVAGQVDRLIFLYQKTQPFDTRIDTLFDVHSGQKYLVDSPDGFVPVSDFVIKHPKLTYEVKLGNQMTVKASVDHLFQHKNNRWIYTSDLHEGDLLITREGISNVVSIKKLDFQEVFDLSVDHSNHRYYTAGVCSHNTGKSLFLQNISLNWVEQGLNVIYITLELSEELVGLRFDAMVTERPTKHIFANIEDTAMKLGAKYRTGRNGIKYGKLQIKSLPGAGTTANDIRAFLKEYEIQTGNRPDALVVDYLDLLHTNSGKINVSDLFVKDKYTSEEMRALAQEWNILACSANQLNRCLSLHTLLISNGSNIKIKDIEIGDWIDSNEGPVKVLAKTNPSKQPVYKIKTKSGKEILCSAKHIFPTTNGNKSIETGLKVTDTIYSRINRED
jgi:KaiC/GvpD/RAD55 family RecA-like ATPase